MESQNTNVLTKRKPRVDWNYKVWSTLLFAIIFATALLYFSYQRHHKWDELWTTYILCVCGCIFGWLIGIITTPYDDRDANKLSKFSTMAGTFISGYLLSKIDGLIGKVLDPKTFFDSFTGLRVMLFISFFLLTWIVVFVFRVYTLVEPRQRATDSDQSSTLNL